MPHTENNKNGITTISALIMHALIVPSQILASKA